MILQEFWFLPEKIEPEGNFQLGFVGDFDMEDLL